MKDKSKFLAIGLVIVTILVVVLSFLFDNKKNDKEQPISIVTNYSNFYTVNSCLFRTISYISQKDTKSLMLLLSDDYKKDNNINSTNVLAFFDEIQNNSNFVSKKMYYQQMNENITKYYVYGYVEDNRLYDDYVVEISNKKDMYFIVYLDSSNKTFMIEPYSGDIFMDGDKIGK